MVEWNLEKIFKESEKEQILIDLKSKVDLFISMKNLLNEKISSEDIIIFFKLKEEILSITSKLQIKIYLKHCEDVTNSSVIKEMQNQDILLTKYSNDLLLSLSEKYICDK